MSETDRAIERAKREIMKAVNEKVIDAALQISQTVILSTPVDTGRARANWQANIGEATTSTIDELDDSGLGRIGKNTQIILQKGDDPTQEVHITNNLSYIGKLNEGSSKQAEAGFVERAVESARDI